MFVIKGMRTTSFAATRRRHAVSVAICIYLANLQRQFCGKNRLCIVNGNTCQTREWDDEYTKTVVC